MGVHVVSFVLSSSGSFTVLTLALTDLSSIRFTVMHFAKYGLIYSNDCCRAKRVFRGLNVV